MLTTRRCLAVLGALTVAASASSASATPRFERSPAAPALSGPPEAIARAYLTARPGLLAGAAPSQLDAGQVRVLPRGRLVRLGQRAFDLPVLGRGAAVRLDEHGAVRWAVADTLRVPDTFDPTPRLDADGARQAAVRALGGAMPGPRSLAPRLVILPLPDDDVRLAWELRLPAGPGRSEPFLVWVDARTGAELGRQPLLVTAEGRTAKVFVDNPVATPDLVEVDLGPMLSGSGNRLRSDAFAIEGCVDRRTCAPLFGGEPYPMCELEQTALPGEDGTYLAIDRPASDTSTTDAFAEVQLMYHLTRALLVFREIGFADLPQSPLTAIANVRFAAYDEACVGGVPPAGGALAPYVNAAYVGRGGLELLPDADALIFGQATMIDFAYDGDVAYHELTHAMMFALVPQLPYGPTFDERGADWTTGGMHEGLADYFSSVVTGNAPLGEYAGLEFDSDAIRTLDNTYLCPDSLIGEVHRDGEAFTAALWTIREALEPDQKPYFDRVVYTVMASLMATDDQLTVARRVEAEVAVVFGDGFAALAAQVFAGRGFVDCSERVIDLPGGVLARAFSRRIGRVSPVPGAVQLRLHNPGAAARLYVTAPRARVEGGVIAVVARPGASPLTWTYAGEAATSDATLAGVLTFTDDTPDDDEPGTLEGTVEGPFAPGPVVVQLTYTGTTRVSDLTFEFTDDHAPPDAGPPPAEEDGGDGGCGCRVGARQASGGASLALGLTAALAGIGLGRRRRRPRRPPGA